MSDPKLHLTCDDVNEALRRVAANTLEVATQEIELAIRNHPDRELDPGRKWAVVWLQSLSTSIRHGEGKDHDAFQRN